MPTTILRAQLRRDVVLAHVMMPSPMKIERQLLSGIEVVNLPKVTCQVSEFTGDAACLLESIGEQTSESAGQRSCHDVERKAKDELVASVVSGPISRADGLRTHRLIQNARPGSRAVSAMPSMKRTASRAP